MEEATFRIAVGDRNSYVNVPWQMHLVVCAARIRPWRVFFAREAQGILKKVVDGVGDGGVRFGAGAEVSTRSQAYAHDMLSAVRAELDRGRVVGMAANAASRVASGARSTYNLVAVAAAGVAVAVAAKAVWDWHDTGGSLSDLGPEIGGATVVGLLGLGAAALARRR